MSVIVKVTCDRDLGEGTCATSAWGRDGEDIDGTLTRAARAGWNITTHTTAGKRGAARTVCPWHASGRPNGTGLL